MKFFATAVSAAAVASAATIGKRDVVFQVSDFTAGCIPHSSQCSYSFGVFQPGTMQTEPIKCSIQATGNPGGALPDVTGGTCEASSRTFAVTRGDAGLTFSVSQPVSPRSNQTGTYLIPADQLTFSGEPNAVVETYTGPTSFDLNSTF
ncbi:hypothetical protein JX265_006857 [Neoarthrinium moseri]|uniref:Hypersensitive response-inducing protein n=1 Tax=Neoarthrinium moseri TaxID=1658444 RepID=A0A9P9WL40_9PEZI|nr:uncharacterized protein JN550_002668 [Neoarthrinium moseri]KAI1846947.1 hypothetical protein JX266_006822 [Neoarthrinium moseri]KAI1868878.1 hypothetical protein JX265_006857 [Neoarthrinium moseri]KAI1874089.1 hypothetical protein JN550_002668 [Neoarthrinium moseri]